MGSKISKEKEKDTEFTGPEQQPQSTRDFDVCNNCGLKGHWAQGCMVQKKQRVSGNWDTAPPGDVTFRNPGG